ARLRRALVFRYHRGGVDGRRRRMRAGRQCLVTAQRAGDRPMPIGQRPPGGQGELVRIAGAECISPGDQFGVRPQVALANLDDVVAFLAQAARDGPVATHRDVHDQHPDPEVLHVRDDLGQVFLGTDQDGVADRIVARQGGQVAADLAFYPLAPARPHPAQPEFQPGQISERVVLGTTAALDGSLIPVAAQQREAGPLPGDAPEKLEKACIIPGYGLSVAGSVDGHRAIRQHVARVHEQRAPVHATPSFPRRETLPAPSRQCDGSRAGRGPPGHRSPLSAKASPPSAGDPAESSAMRLLVLGGTRFLGRAIVDEAISRGYDVTTFSRGLSGEPRPGAEALHGDRTSYPDLLRLADRDFDAAIDTSVIAPVHVAASAQILAGRISHYTYV